MICRECKNWCPKKKTFKQLVSEIESRMPFDEHMYYLELLAHAMNRVFDIRGSL